MSYQDHRHNSHNPEGRLQLDLQEVMGNFTHSSKPFYALGLVSPKGNEKAFMKNKVPYSGASSCRIRQSSSLAGGDLKSSPVAGRGKILLLIQLG